MLKYSSPNPCGRVTSCWGRVGEFLVAREQEIIHTKPFFFPFSSAATCTNRPLEVYQRDSHMADELVVPLKFPGDSVHFLSLLVLESVIYNLD
ncbi:hypothetical protein Taro_055444 [Colocasia esculenta]|uniref:Uncharacterized protein n=1 Tax=Colocasia esculenta TaxID=4460 RepID=A0A843XTG4_COLES|nr:hypothetical protein [Colocasia esculenta]